MKSSTLIVWTLFLAAATAVRGDPAYDYVDSGLSKFIHDDYDGAIADYNKAINLKPGYGEAYDRRAQAELAKGDSTDAVADYGTYIALNPNDPDAYDRRGYAKQSKGDLDGAIADYSKYLESNPNDATAYYNRATVKNDKGDTKGALEDYTKAIELRPDDALYFGNRGVVKSNTGDYDGAISDYNKSIALQSDDPMAYHNRAIARLSKGDLAGAITDYSAVLKLKPDDAQTYFDRGILRYDTRDFTNALADFRLITGDYARFRVWLIRVRSGDADAATKELQTYLGSRTIGKPDDWESKIGHYLAGQLPEQEFFAAAKNADPRTESTQLCEGYFYAGSKHLFAGDKAVAMTSFQEAIAMNHKGLDEYDSAAAELKFMQAAK